jgi:hypothetical protein
MRRNIKRPLYLAYGMRRSRRSIGSICAKLELHHDEGLLRRNLPGNYDRLAARRTREATLA